MGASITVSPVQVTVSVGGQVVVATAALQGPAGTGGSGGGAFIETRAPLATDDNTHGFAVGNLWLYTATGYLYCATSVVTNAAVWDQVAVAVTSVPWSDITGTPTTLSGYGVTVVPWGDVTGEPTTLAGYGITDSLATSARLVGGGELSTGLTLDLATISPPAGTYGSSTEIPVLVVDTYGRVTSATQVAAAGGSYPANMTEYAASAGTYTITSAPVGTTFCKISGWGSGGGGGSGACQTSGLAASGGAAGAGAMYAETFLPVASLVFPLTVTSPLGGAGGAGKGTTQSAGTPGVHGANATVTDGNGKQLFIADGVNSSSSGGAGGALAGNSSPGTARSSSASGGTVSLGVNGSGGTNGAAGTANNNGYGPLPTGLGAPGGSSGGGVSTTPAAFAGGTGIAGPYLQGAQTGATAGTLGGGNAGPPPANYDGALLPGAGGGGGGSSITGNGGNGSAGASYGAGGGGGGACLTGFTSGAGGNGGPGVVVVQFI